MQFSELWNFAQIWNLSETGQDREDNYKKEIPLIG